MEDENPKKRNIRPTEKSNLPVITLFVLVLLVLAMLYVGYEYISDDATNSEELTSAAADTSEEKPVTSEMTDDEEEEDAVVAVEEKPKVLEEKMKEETKKEEPKKLEDPKVVAAKIGGREITRTVKSGETFSSLASKYNLTTESLKSLNPSISELKAGDKLKIRVKAVHTVGPGDILKVVSGKYDVSKEAIMKANGKSKDVASRGEELVIPFPTRR